VNKQREANCRYYFMSFLFLFYKFHLVKSFYLLINFSTTLMAYTPLLAKDAPIDVA
jgi:hypothetical protein